MDQEYESKVTRLLEHINNFDNLKNKAKQTTDEQKYAIPMQLFQVINYTIDIADYVITKRKFGYPSTYADSFEILASYKIITSDLKLNLQKLCQYRNIIAHEYHMINKEELDEIVQLLSSITDFISICELALKEK